MKLNALIIAIAAIWTVAAAAQDTAPEREYILRETGAQCRTAPCPTMSATDVATGQSTAILSVDLSALGLTAAQRRALVDDLNHGRVVVLGRLQGEVPRTVALVTRVLRRAPGAPAPRTRLRGEPAAQNLDRLLPLLIDLPGFQAAPAQPNEIRATMSGGQPHASVPQRRVFRVYEMPGRNGSILASLGTLEPLSAASMAQGRDTPYALRWQMIGAFRVGTVVLQGRVVGLVVTLNGRNTAFSLDFRDFDVSAERALELARRFDWPAMREQVSALRL